MQLVDGYSAYVVSTFPTMNVTLFIRERELQPPAVDLGGQIETTTMLNNFVRTHAAKSLATIGELTLQCQYDPGIYAQMLSVVADSTVSGSFRFRQGQNASHIITFPDGARFGFFGWYEKITPPSHKEGDFPLMEVKIQPSNRCSFTGTFMDAVATLGAEFVPRFEQGRNYGVVAR